MIRILASIDFASSERDLQIIADRFKDDDDADRTLSFLPRSIIISSSEIDHYLLGVERGPLPYSRQGFDSCAGQWQNHCHANGTRP